MATIGSLTADLRLESAAFIRDLGRAANEVSKNTGIMTRQFRAVQAATQSAANTLKGLFTVSLARMAIRQMNRLARESLNAAAAIDGPLGNAVRDFQATNQKMTQAFEVGFGVAYVQAFTNALGDSESSLKNLTSAGILFGTILGAVFGKLVKWAGDLAAAWEHVKRIATLSGPASFAESNPLAFGNFTMGEATLAEQIQAAINATNALTPALENNAAAVSKWKTTVTKDVGEATKSIEMFSDQWIGSLQSTLGGISSFSGALSAEQEEWFRVNQAVSIAQALVATYTGAAEALKLGPIIGPALAAIQVATGLAYVAQIAAQSPGAGTTSAVGGVGGRKSGKAVTEASSRGSGSAGGQAVNITLAGGPMWGRESVRGLIDEINKAVGDGATIRVN